MCMFPFIITTRCRFNTDVSHAICYWHRHKGVFVYSAICMRDPGGCFTNVSRALQKNLAKIYNARNYIYGENSKLKLCTCAQSMALGTRTKFQLELLIRNAISAIHKFRENILESSRNVSETTPRTVFHWRFASCPKHSLEICLLQNSNFLWEFQAEILYVYPKHYSKIWQAAQQPRNDHVNIEDVLSLSETKVLEAFCPFRCCARWTLWPINKCELHTLYLRCGIR